MITLKLIRLVESPRGELAQVVVIQRARQLRRYRRACGLARIEHLGRRAHEPDNGQEARQALRDVEAPSRVRNKPLS